jgi:hypothetical protein
MFWLDFDAAIFAPPIDGRQTYVVVHCCPLGTERVAFIDCMKPDVIRQAIVWVVVEQISR